MPDLVNLLDHMKGKSVLVNGTIYQIDERGIAEGVSEADAIKLLGAKHWMVFDPEAAAKREERRKAIREDFKRQRGGIQLIDSGGQVIDPKAEAEAAKAEAEAKAKEALPPSAEEIPSMQPEAPAAKAVNAEVSEDEALENEIDEALPDPEQNSSKGDAEMEAAGDEWPDPHMGMTKSQLQEIADAYELSYTGKNSKQELIDMIMEAMYAQP